MAQAPTINISARTELKPDTNGEGGQCHVCQELIFREGYVVMIHFEQPVSLAGTERVYCKLCQSCGSELKRMREERKNDKGQNPKAHGQPCWN